MPFNRIVFMKNTKKKMIIKKVGKGAWESEMV